MVKNYLDWLRANTTKERFINVLKMTEEDIKFNRLGFSKVTSQKEFIEICKISFTILNREGF